MSRKDYNRNNQIKARLMQQELERLKSKEHATTCEECPHYGYNVVIADTGEDCCLGCVGDKCKYAGDKCLTGCYVGGKK